MRSFIQTAALITACGSAVFWFASDVYVSEVPAARGALSVP